MGRSRTTSSSFSISRLFLLWKREGSQWLPSSRLAPFGAVSLSPLLEPCCLCCSRILYYVTTDISQEAESRDIDNNRLDQVQRTEKMKDEGAGCPNSEVFLHGRFLLSRARGACSLTGAPGDASRSAVERDVLS